jgi:hypothetical protein
MRVIPYEVVIDHGVHYLNAGMFGSLTTIHTNPYIDPAFDEISRIRPIPSGYDIHHILEYNLTNPCSFTCALDKENEVLKPYDSSTV